MRSRSRRRRSRAAAEVRSSVAASARARRRRVRRRRAAVGLAGAGRRRARGAALAGGDRAAGGGAQLPELLVQAGAVAGDVVAGRARQPCERAGASSTARRPWRCRRAAVAPARRGPRCSRPARPSRRRGSASSTRRPRRRRAASGPCGGRRSEITGTRSSATVRHSVSSQNANRSASDPPPRATTITSTSSHAARSCSLRVIAGAACRSCTGAKPHTTRPAHRGAAARRARRRAPSRLAGDHADALRQPRPRQLLLRREQPFGVEALAQLVELREQIALARDPQPRHRERERRRSGPRAGVVVAPTRHDDLRPVRQRPDLAACRSPRATSSTAARRWRPGARTTPSPGPALNPNTSPKTWTRVKPRRRSLSAAAYWPTGNGPVRVEPGCRPSRRSTLVGEADDAARRVSRVHRGGSVPTRGVVHDHGVTGSTRSYRAGRGAAAHPTRSSRNSDRPSRDVTPRRGQRNARGVAATRSTRRRARLLGAVLTSYAARPAARHASSGRKPRPRRDARRGARAEACGGPSWSDDRQQLQQQHREQHVARGLARGDPNSRGARGRAARSTFGGSRQVAGPLVVADARRACRCRPRSGVPRTSPVKPRLSSLAISPRRRGGPGESAGRPATSFWTRLRIWYEKCGVAEATS